MTEKVRELRKTLVEELLHRAGAAWGRYKSALKRSDMKIMRDEYEAVIQLLQPVYSHGFKKEVEDFLKKTDGMPVRAILKRLRK